MISQPTAGLTTEQAISTVANIADRMGQIEARIRRIHTEARCFGSEPWQSGVIRLLSQEYESLADQRFILTDRLLVPELYPA